MQEDNLTPRLTGDGSYTLHSTQAGQCYHSERGALSESSYVFAQRGLEMHLTQAKTRILEVGFGTGLNLLATLEWCYKHSISCSYTGVELFPLPLHVLLSLPNPNANDSLLVSWHKALDAPWGEKVSLPFPQTTTEENAEGKESLSLLKLHADILTLELESKGYDTIYHDAFSIDTQPELWSVILFRRLFQALRPGGCLVTYSSAGQVKQALRGAGFHIERLPGALGKHHMIRAWRNVEG